MRHKLCLCCVLLSMLAVGACHSPTQVTPTATPTASLPPGFVLTISPDHTFQLAYPAEWRVQRDSQDLFTGSAGQFFEADNAGPSGDAADLRQLVTSACNEFQPGMGITLVQTTTVRLGGQPWTQGRCDDGKPSIITVVMVEVILYKGSLFKIAYGSPAASFASDQTRYFALMEQSFHFLL